jgi:DNA-binding FrmR family transcriptional regulator
MPHSPADKKRILTRVRRIRGQVDALERALESGEPCLAILQQIAAVRGAANGLMGEMVEIHLKDELVTGRQPRTSGQSEWQKSAICCALI